jgi:chorismate mutase / prephenate dehydratase
MSATADLDDLRSEIDRIDDALLDALAERLALVRRVAMVKNDSQGGKLAMRPAREAAILRRLVGRNGGRLPTATVVAMWRELLAATTRLQTPFVVAVHVPAGQPGYWDLARDHFGVLTPLIRADGPSHALRALDAGAAQLAVLPLPDETDPWWRALAYGREPTLRIVGRLPFCPAPRSGALSALVVAALEPEPSGDDVTMLAIEAGADLSRDGLGKALSEGALAPRWIASQRDEQAETSLHLVEVAGFVGEREPELTEVMAPIRSRILRVTALGSYPRPLDDSGEP